MYHLNRLVVLAVMAFQPVVFRVCLTLTVSFGVCTTQQAVAQKNDTGKEIAKGLLRALIESQLERQGRETYGPGRPVPPVVSELPRPVQATPEMIQLRRTLASLTQESHTLSDLAVDEASRNPELRKLVPDTISFHASTTATQLRADRENNHLAIQLPVQSLSQSWKLLAHKLSTTRGLSPAIRQSSDRVSQLEAQLCRTLGIRDQFNSRELVRAADLLAADLHTLTDEVAYAAATTNDRNRLVVRMRRQQDQAALFANLAASGAQFPAVVAEYQNLFQAWQVLRPEIDQFSVRGVNRSVAKIQETHRTIHQLLRLEFGLDQALIQKMAEGVERDLNELFRIITLEQLMSLPDSRSLPASADALFGTAQNLADVVSRREPLQAVGEAWLYLDERWHLFEFYLQPIRSVEIRRRIEGISQSIDSLQDAIGVTVSFDRRAVLQQVATLDGLVEHLQSTVRRWLTHPGQQNIAMANEMQSLTDRCRELGVLAGSSQNPTVLATKCDEVITIWQQLRPKLGACQTDEKESIEQTIDSLIPILIQLRTMMEN